MKIEFKREVNRNYMVLKPEPGKEDPYAIQMLTRNPLNGFLPFREKTVNGETRYYYDITSRQPLERILESRALTGSEIRQIISGLLEALIQLELFLLEEDGLCLEPELIYVEPDTFQCSWCLIPGRKESFPEGVRSLTQYLLDHVNQNDGEAVVLAFGIFKQTRKENFGVEDLERELRKLEEPKPVLFPEIERKPKPLPFPESERKPAAWKEEAEQGKPESKSAEQPLLPLLFMIPALLTPVAALYLFFGVSGLLLYKWPLLAGELLLVGVGLVFRRSLRKRPFQEERDETRGRPKERPAELFPEQSEFEVFFREEEEFPKVSAPAKEEAFDDEEMRTVLLTAQPLTLKTHKLVPLQGGEEIPVNYFPFLIGKNKSLCDYFLNEPGVSRLHLKIEETDSGYAVTDLNSTNGTSVNGRLLETNESHGLSLGDEIGIAGKVYRFL